jgi:hypothetical protein
MTARWHNVFLTGIHQLLIINIWLISPCETITKANVVFLSKEQYFRPDYLSVKIKCKLHETLVRMSTFMVVTDGNSRKAMEIN